MATDYPPWVPFSQIELEYIEWLLPMVPNGMLTLLCGHPGVGKSLLTCRWAAELSKQGKRTVLVSAEDSPGVTKARLLAAEADTENVVYSPAIPFGNGAWPWFVDQVVATNADLLILDPFTAMMAETQSSWSDHHVRRALAPLAEMAHEFEIAIVYILHLNKAQGSDPLMRVGGSVAFPAASRSAILVGSEPNDETGRVRLSAHMKCNVAELLPTLRWVITPRILLRDNRPDLKTASLDFLGTCGFSAPDMLVPTITQEDKTKLDQAQEMIRSYLAFGAIPSNDLDSAGDAMGISRRTLMDARAALGVQAEQRGRRWFVSLAGVTSSECNAQDAKGRLHSENPHGYQEESFSVQGYGDTHPEPETVSQSQESISGLDWLGTARLDELHRGLDTD